MTFDYKITVFTPTYNRAYIIENLFRSLRRQTFHDFEWLVVDDGSKDNTAEVFAAWMQEENPFPIRYIKQENGGKCRAINHGLKEARGELFFTVDSDDYLTDDALEKIVKWEEDLPKDERFCGLAGNLGTGPNETVNAPLPGDYVDGNAFNRYDLVEGERASVFYTEIHRKYLYPEFPGEKFLTEAVAWNKMAVDGYKMRFFNDIIWIYEYKEDGLTNAGYQLFLDNPRGTALFFRQKAEYFRYDRVTMLGMWYGFVCDAKERLTDKEIAEAIGMPYLLVAPMRWVHTFIQFKRKLRKEND